MNRRVAVMMVAALVAGTLMNVGTTMALEEQERPPFAGALAVWNMDKAPAEAMPFAPVTDPTVKTGIALAGRERAESLAHGGDGLAAEFKGGLLLGREVAKFKNNALTIHLRAQLPKPVGGNGLILQYGEGKDFLFKLYTRLADEKEAKTYFRRFRADGKCPVLEFELNFPLTNIMRLAVPLAIIGETDWHDITIRYDGPTLQLRVDGVLADEDWPVGDISGNPGYQFPQLVMGFDKRWAKFNKTTSNGPKTADDQRFLLDHLAIWNRAITEEELAVWCGGAERIGERQIVFFGQPPRNVQYWTPPGYNTWVGDTMSLYHAGRFHLFYLPDRRHHSSKGGAAAHQIAHMSSADLVHWEHHPMPAPITEQWQTMGTGCPFVHDGKIHLAYGLHIHNRFLPAEKTNIPLFRHELETSGSVKAMSFDEIFSKGLWPNGATVAVSEDGIHFRQQRMILHLNENPTIVRAGSSPFYMTGEYGAKVGHGGIWESPDLVHWKRSDKKLPSWRECTCFFEWNGRGYAIGGRSGLSMSENGLLGKYAPLSQAYDGAATAPVYDGLFVPMVAAFKDNRRILTGFGPFEGWGGHLVFRELIQRPDGSLGMKWPAEMHPQDGAGVSLGEFVESNGKKLAGASPTLDAKGLAWAKAITPPKSFHLRARIVPEGEAGEFGLGMLGAQGWQLRFVPKTGVAQWETSLADEPRAEAMDLRKKAPWQSGDFAIRGVREITKPFELEIVVKYDAKSLRTIVDAQIGGGRTMITSRMLPPDARSSLFLFAKDGKVRFENVRMNELVE